MKFIRKSLKESGALPLFGLNLVLSMILIFIDINQIIWITNAFSDPYNSTKWVYMIIGSIVLQCILDIIKEKVVTMAIHKNFLVMVKIFHSKIMSMDYNAFVSISPSSIGTSAKDLWRVAKIPWMTVNLIKNITVLVFTIGSVTILSPSVIMPIVLVYGVMAIIGLKLFNMWGELDKKLDDVGHQRAGEMDVSINGFQEIRSFCTQDFHARNIEKMNNKSTSFVDKRSNVGSMIGGLFNSSTGAVTIGMMLYLLESLKNGTTIAATATAIIVLVWKLFGPLQSVIDFMDQFSDMIAPLPRMNKVLDYENKITTGSVVLKEFTNSIKFKNVSFQYNDSHEVLKGINMTIRKGQHIGICGPSGGGKSTLIKLIPRFYDVSLGSLSIDGVNIKDYDINSVRSKISIVAQDMYIFDGTILQNVMYGNEHANMIEVIDACKKAAIYDFIQEQPDKFDTLVGNRGIKLSGGQCQRLALARIFLKNSDIVILDEATSSLDNESESIIQESLNQFKGKTIISIAHRLTTIQDCDEIYYIDNHKVVEHGTHDYLMSKQGSYYKMVMSKK